MEKVFPVEVTASLPRTTSRPGKGILVSSVDAKMGVLEKIVSPGCFVVLLEDGSRIEVRGSATLRPGNRVRVLPQPSNSREPETLGRGTGRTAGNESGFQMSALIPLAFGGVRAEASLKVYVGGKSSKSLGKSDSAVYFVFTVLTESQGTLQWSIHLRGRQVTLQVHGKFDVAQKEGLKSLVREVEGGLKRAGFSLAGPTIFLNRPFQVPDSFRLNVTG